VEELRMGSPAPVVRVLAVPLVALLAPAPESLAQNHHVVIISIDGLAASRLEDEGLELPSLRGVARAGAWAESSETVFPPTDHPGHVTIVTGVSPREHGVIGNRLLHRETGEYFHITNAPRAESVKARTLFDAAKAKGLRTAALFWPETRDDPAIDHALPVVLAGDGMPDKSATDPALLEELRKNGVVIDLFFEWYNDLALQTTADRILTRAAAYVFRTYRPHLLALRLPALERFQHQYGPDHYLSKAALTAADYNVGLVRRAIEDAGLESQTTLFVVSDHGFQTVTHSVNLYPLFERSRLLGKVNLHAGYWTVLVELTKDFDPARDSRKLEEVLDDVASLEGVSRIVRPDEHHALGVPRYEESPYVLGHYIIVGDVDTRAVIDEQSTSTKRVALPTPLYGHAYLPTHEVMYPLFLAVGRGVKQGVRTGHVHNYDIAPTVAALLGLEMPGLRGRVLKEILE
jgi:predicted AlkP superfamily pyrophosphatase or phosphodiesterase